MSFQDNPMQVTPSVPDVSPLWTQTNTYVFDNTGLRAPGITFVVHLGAVQDLVTLEFQHDQGTTYDLYSGSVYVTAGYALTHRTHRSSSTDKRKRYSITFFFKFNKEHVKQMDAYIHRSYDGLTSDSFNKRIQLNRYY